MVRAEQPTRERLTWFWHGHFATSVAEGPGRGADARAERDAPHARARRLRDRWLRRMIVDPAMLIWLDGNDNTAKAPNENLAREFMELFALGHGSYGETDVKEAARALTGWKVERADRRGRARARSSTTTAARPCSARPATSAPRSSSTVLLDQPASAEFMVRRLWFRLVSTPAAAGRDPRTACWPTYGPGRDVTATSCGAIADPGVPRPGHLAGQAAGRVGRRHCCRALDRTSVGGSRRPTQTSARRLLAGEWARCRSGRRASAVGRPVAAWLTTARRWPGLNAGPAAGGAADLRPSARRRPRNRTEAVRRLLGVDAFSTRTANAVGAGGGSAGRRRRRWRRSPPSTSSPAEGAP